MSGIIWNLVSFVVALGILVTVHEFGHFWVARRCGIKVETFSIGFGKALWKKVGKDGTVYTIAMIPLGGYVKMLDSRVDTVSQEQRHQAFDHKSLWQRVAVVSAGPMFNFLFAIFAYWLVFTLGTPTVKPVVGSVEQHSIAAQGGLKSGMQITSVSGVSTPDWQSVNMQLASHIGDKQLTLTVASPNDIGMKEIKTFNLSSWNFKPDSESAMGALGFKPYRPSISPTLVNISANGAGAQAGLQVGDTLASINGVKVTDWQQVVNSIKSHPNKPLKLTVIRNGSLLPLTLVPEPKKLSKGQVIGFAGIAPKVAQWPENYRFDLQYGVIESVGKAIDKTGQVIHLTGSMLKKLVVGDVGLNNLSGPISIAKGAGATADYGFVYFLGFLALISINLGIINLVPLPMLDGGHLLFFAIEAIIRRPVPEKVQEMGYRIGGAIIFSLMAVAIFNDFTRL
ncbi:sigma E protease regulator RseP [Vibrio palustris]|uniref:Zinc metalloprotease n=1 Tax=Vibrio palustris TaxID=1918946 RepID=A0A1R4B032_9VIBR|nr:sigma E protease regulator RseP [Vibrio palustris]SJL82247.1 Regulator of sigma-E protease RseP [Vibrio palustris]